MNFQSVFYYKKYLKYAKDRGRAYFAIKNTIDNYSQQSSELMQKAQRAITSKNNKQAIEYLDLAVKIMPVNFDTNLLLGKLYLEENDNMHAMIYLKRALALDSKSLDVLQKLSSVFINLGDYTAAYCSMRRLLPLVIHNQQEYLKTLQLVKDLDSSFDELSYQGHKEWAEKYYDDNNYHMALMEYENCAILKEHVQADVEKRLEKLKSFLYPEERIIKACIEKGSELYTDGDYKNSNKYFTKVMLFTNENSAEYKYAKARMVNI